MLNLTNASDSSALTLFSFFLILFQDCIFPLNLTCASSEQLFHYNYIIAGKGESKTPEILVPVHPFRC